ncbi:MAG: anti-anti-sigma factor [Oceanospirillaceae bacterium]|nr:anti-anti-sigma factor [Oceanospirillaceae bacterium]MBT13138.1 anti-anti-sigma factor [Oceanospirillaceae bacterium]|tara:strand:- start:65188 stop:65490 length:303 start_codon:yes stop_codon:yes gene_type:complete
MAELKCIDEQTAELSGDLLHGTVTDVIVPGRELITAAGSQWTVDMQGVGQVSSSGVALVLEWLRAAETANCTLRIRHLPDHMRPIIDISDLEPLFAPLLT